MTQSHLLDGLNENQRIAVCHGEGPRVVFAGAGSGKTRIITNRIAYLIEKGVPPWEILAVTFTNKAAAEMKQRVEAICPSAKRATITTFHSACARWLREFASELGFTSNFTIFDESDANNALKKVIKEADPKADIPSTLPDYKAFLHFAKTSGHLPHDVERLEDQLPYVVPIGALAIYQRYQEFLADCNGMDFGDLLLNMLLLLRRNKTVQEILTRRFSYILVDEFQDTNQTQFEIVSRLAARHNNLFVVGDDDQSIYSWRGATPANILDFERNFPGALKTTLEQNYRCSANIIKAASTVIANNKKRVEKKLFTTAAPGDPVEINIEADNEMEAMAVAEAISEEKVRFPFDDIAIFYRTNSQSRSLEDALRRYNIPYRIYGSVEFYDRLEIKDLLAYLKLLVNEQDELSLRRIINVPARGLGQKAVETIEREARARRQGMLATIHQLADEGVPRIGPKLRYLSDLLQALKKDILAAELDDIIGILLDALDYDDYLKKKFPDQYIDKIDNIHELGSALADYSKKEPNPSLAAWLESISLIRDDRDPTAKRGVSLMTLHMAKGLEYPRVFLVGMEEGLLPHRNSLDDQDQLEEERRLVYVGITRAKEKISLYAASRRRSFQNFTANLPSRFLTELPQDILSMNLAAQSHLQSYRYQSSKWAQAQYDDANEDHDEDELMYEADPSQLKAGMSVMHPTYGRGIIESFDTRFGQFKVVVSFHEFGLRKIKPSQLSLPQSSLRL